MNRDFDILCRIIAACIGLILCPGFGRGEVPPPETPPEEVRTLTNRLVEILNSDRLWELGPLLRPDLPAQKAMEWFVDTNSGIDPDSTPEPLAADSSYKVLGFDKIDKLFGYKTITDEIWFSKYGRSESETVNAIWIRKGKLWKLHGFGRSDSDARRAVREYLKSVAGSD
jgi:hypothetical protein